MQPAAASNKYSGARSMDSSPKKTYSKQRTQTPGHGQCYRIAKKPTFAKFASCTPQVSYTGVRPSSIAINTSGCRPLTLISVR